MDDWKDIQGISARFDGQMAGRQVLLLIDDFSALYAGLNLFYEEYPQRFEQYQGCLSTTS